MRRLFRHPRRSSVVALLAALAVAAPVYAGFQSETLYVLLADVEYKGNLSPYSGRGAPFYSIINTRTGKFCGSATGRVSNQSGRCQCYRNVNLFNFVTPTGVSSGGTTSGNGYYYVSISCSQYVVQQNGFASYCASGTLEDDIEN